MKISFIYMASGFGSRFGSNKLLVPFKGKALYRHGLDCICRAAGELEKEGYQTEVLVVSQYEEILEKARDCGRSLTDSAARESPLPSGWELIRPLLNQRRFCFQWLTSRI